MQLDIGRQFDLQDLYLAHQQESSSHRRQQFERTATEILREGKTSRRLRDVLIRSMRTGDLTTMKRCQEELRRLKAEEINNSRQL